MNGSMKINEIIVITLDNGNISLHRYTDNQNEIILSSLFVRKNRRNGNGANLMAHAERIAKGLDATCVSLEVKKGSWQSKWYERLGYRYCERKSNIDSLVWMRKYLGK